MELQVLPWDALEIVDVRASEHALREYGLDAKIDQIFDQQLDWEKSRPVDLRPKWRVTITGMDIKTQSLKLNEVFESIVLKNCVVAPASRPAAHGRVRDAVRARFNGHYLLKAKAFIGVEATHTESFEIRASYYETSKTRNPLNKLEIVDADPKVLMLMAHGQDEGALRHMLVHRDKTS